MPLQLSPRAKLASANQQESSYDNKTLPLISREESGVTREEEVPLQPPLAPRAKPASAKQQESRNNNKTLPLINREESGVTRGMRRERGRVQESTAGAPRGRQGEAGTAAAQWMRKLT